MMGFEDGERRALWDTPLAHAPALIKKLLEEKWDPNTLINVNFPDAPPEAGEGHRGRRRRASGIRRCSISTAANDPWGTPYFWFGFERRISTLVPGTDLAAIAENKISVTPLSVDLTDRSACKMLAPRLG